jgi:hypothetical protein
MTGGELPLTARSATAIFHYPFTIIHSRKARTRLLTKKTRRVIIEKVTIMFRTPMLPQEKRCSIEKGSVL